jgi:hypothetical protein
VNRTPDGADGSNSCFTLLVRSYTGKEEGLELPFTDKKQITEKLKAVNKS